LEIERTFWEKATILHAEYHQPEDKTIKDRFSRHFSDFAALWQHPYGQVAKTRLDLQIAHRALPGPTEHPPMIPEESPGGC
jgi:hypothetical protein